MKTTYLKLIFFMCMFVAGVTAAHAQAYLQDPQYGKTPEERQKVVELINYFQDAYTLQEYDKAIGILNQIRAIKPDANAAIYTNASNIYKRRINAAQSVAEKNAFVDSLMMVYDWRIEYFGDKPETDKKRLQMMKANDYAELKPADKEGIRALYTTAIDAYGTEVPLNDLLVYFDFLTTEYMALRLETDIYMTEYEKFEKLIDASSDPEKEAYKGTFESKFIQSGAANCETVEKIYRPRIAESPDNIDNYKKAFQLLTIGKCESDFMYELAESLYKIEPSTQMALYLSQMYMGKGDIAKSTQYVQEAINTETDPAEKSRLMTQLASIEQTNGNTSNAMNLARQSLAIDPNNGMAQLILANAYASANVSGCSAFDQKAYFWAIYDMAAKARTLLEEMGETALLSNADAIMAGARRNWPETSELQLRGLAENSPYTVSCGGLSQSTRVRGK